MGSMFIRCKNLSLTFILLSIALLLIITNHLFFIINYTRHLQDDFQDVTTYFRRLRNPSWLEVVSRDIIDKRIRIGLVKMDRVKQAVPIHAKKNTTTYFKWVENPVWFEAIRREFKVGKINIGLVNTGELMDEVWTKAMMVDVHFERVGEYIQWSDLAPERVYENSTCPDIPMPEFENYKDLDVVIARVPHSIDDEDGGLKDVFRLQVNLVVANLLVRSGRKGSGPLMAVFVKSLEPMWEIFRCDDLFWNEGNTWIYKPEMTMIKKLALMPVGPCQFVPPSSIFGDDQELWRKETSHHLQPREAYVTVLHTTEDYVCGAIVLAQSIIQSNTTKDLILFADDSISAESIEGLQAAGWKTERIERIRSPFSRKHAYNEWNYSKLRIWQLKQYEKLMFIDADLLVIRNLDEFFVYPQLSAAGNYQKHLFNSGLMIVEPSQCTFDILMKKMVVVESYNGGDQGFLNEMFAWWHRLPHELNFMKVFIEQNDTEHVIVDEFYALHYTGLKPWKCSGERDCNWDVPAFHRYASDSAHGMWWGVYRGMPEKLRSYCSQNRNSV
ncbi:hypothetical protein ACS0TY_025341 [Phlomoides rotata]